MGSNGSAVVHTVQANLGKASEMHTLGTGDAQIREIILDEAFVTRVSAAIDSLNNLTGLGYYDYVANITVRLLESSGEMVWLADVRHALDYLAESGKIELPALAGV